MGGKETQYINTNPLNLVKNNGYLISKIDGTPSHKNYLETYITKNEPLKDKLFSKMSEYHECLKYLKNKNLPDNCIQIFKDSYSLFNIFCESKGVSLPPLN